MKPLRADEDDLRVTAARWHAVAGDLVGAAPNVPAASSQASAAVVNEIHAGAAVTEQAFAARIRITAIKTDAAATLYAAQDAAAATKLDDIAKALEA
ncbi:hypothetical protein BMW24_013835 [Mycobacterium heckeshornense]|uniref:Uncharacterized protein n=1 Tax=Mycobacterium heckeshornense TaxID=110505 RepID=A0A2G8B8F6_9MYCO|nr:hypothetical protein [Mycobacterium heckeshornense]MCV7033291.1 hypothetical protein [Mycobacterium heckeshornense]PIJ34041.1 hypothetical protein BMW24_013835 [Mycobacterium heckeshornense]BCO37437.1 hypothetical protein MHEC_38700 [Mycobacterium heckeshornense]